MKLFKTIKDILNKPREININTSFIEIQAQFPLLFPILFVTALASSAAAGYSIAILIYEFNILADIRALF